MVDVLRSLDVLDVQLDVVDGEDVVDNTITYGAIHVVKPVKISQPSELPCNIL